MAAFIVVPALSSIHTPRRRRSTTPWLGARPASSCQSLFVTGASVAFSSPCLPLPKTVTDSPRRQQKRRVPTAVIGGGGFLGVGPGEVVVILAVGWFLLGPTKMYSLAKDSGKILGQLRSAADEARSNFEEALELELESEKEQGKSKQTKEADEEDNSSTTPNETTVNTQTETESKSESEPSPIPDFDISSLSATSMSSSSPTSTSTPQAPEQAVEGPSSNSQFLDQLKRVADSNQTAPSDVPDLDVNLEVEEEEVQRLEKQYLEARARLNARKQVPDAAANVIAGEGPVNEGVTEQTDSSSGPKT